MTARPCILDYGAGNVRSVFNLLETISPGVVVENRPETIEAATHLILPGVGAFGASMEKIRRTLPLDLVSRRVLEERIPYLGICVGMQILADEGSEFGSHAGLGWIPGRVDRLESAGEPLPHIGWNSVESTREDPLFEGLGESPDFYFVHSYSFRPAQGSHGIGTTFYGSRFVSAIRRDNIVGVQFHPEKSQTAGRRLIANFLATP